MGLSSSQLILNLNTVRLDPANPYGTVEREEWVSHQGKLASYINGFVVGRAVKGLAEMIHCNKS